MRRTVFVAVATALVVAASEGTAMAAGQALCVGAPGEQIRSPESDGQCKKGNLVTLATEEELTALQGRVSALETENTALKVQVSRLQSDNAALQGGVSALQSKLAQVTYDPTGLNGTPTLRISGANLQIVNGSGHTGRATNGLGNVVIGYDEHPSGYDQTGSHNLVLGENQQFGSYGGIAGGYHNTLTAPFSAAFGAFNTANGTYSSVTGGVSNTASGTGSSVSGGDANTASGSGSSVSGGYSNTADGYLSSILGGAEHTVSAGYGTSP